MKLKTRLSFAFAFIVIFTITLISSLANVFIKNEFKKYVISQHEKKIQEIVSNIGSHYNPSTNRWNIDAVHTMGIYALYEGYIVKAVDNQDIVLWDAEECDMEGCEKVIRKILDFMESKYPNMGGEFITKTYPLINNEISVGTISIRHYSPNFLDNNYYYFIETLNVVLFFIGITSLILSLIIGMLMSNHISKPISEAAVAARQMVSGDYAAHVNINDSTEELVDLANSINLLANSLSYQENLRKQLSADVAHELRTPVTSVQTHLEAMIEGLWEISPKRLSSCHEEILRIGILVTDLECLAKVENDYEMLNKSSTNLSCIIYEAIGALERDKEIKELTITVEGTAPEVFVDEHRIYQVIINLLSNAIKYTPKGGCINIDLSQEEDFVVFAIADNGIGISDADLPFIFERFYRADKSRSRKTGGYGIGLAVVKAVVKAHGGKIEAESSIGNGSRFKILLPIRELNSPH